MKTTLLACSALGAILCISETIINGAPDLSFPHAEKQITITGSPEDISPGFYSIANDVAEKPLFPAKTSENTGTTAVSSFQSTVQIQNDGSDAAHTGFKHEITAEPAVTELMTTDVEIGQLAAVNPLTPSLVPAIEANEASADITNPIEATNNTDLSNQESESKHAATLSFENTKTEVVGLKQVETPAITSVTALQQNNRLHTSAYAASFSPESGADHYSSTDILERAYRLKQLAKENGFNTSYAFVVDMGMKSGKKRFFIVDLTNMTIAGRGIVAHGKGASRIYNSEKKYSNEIGSRCTSLGIYRIGKNYEGSYGSAFKLHGLENTNSNAYKRSLVLHAMKNIPYNEIDYPIFQSEGCPSVSPQFMQEVSRIISKSTKPILMWMFDSTAETEFSYAQQ